MRRHTTIRGQHAVGVPETVSKTCRLCERALPLSEFSPQRATCRSCRSKQNIAWKRGSQGTVTQVVRVRARCETSWCNRYALASSSMCGVCERDTAPDSEYALTGGRWVPVRGVLKWVSAT